MTFNFLNLFRPNDHKEDYWEGEDKIFLIEIRDKEHIHAGGNLLISVTNDKLVKSSSNLGFNEIKFIFAHDKENFYFMLHQRYIPIQNYKTSTEKNEYVFLYKKCDELKGNNTTDENEDIVEYGNDFINCKLLHNRKWT